MGICVREYGYSLLYTINLSIHLSVWGKRERKKERERERERKRGRKLLFLFFMYKGNGGVLGKVPLRVSITLVCTSTEIHSYISRLYLFIYSVIILFTFVPIRHTFSSLKNQLEE